MNIVRTTHIALCALACASGSIMSLADPSPQERRAASRETKPDLSSPQTTVDSFTAAIRRGDMDTAAKCVVSVGPYTAPIPSGPGGAAFTLSNTEFKIEGDVAEFTAKVSLKIGGVATDNGLSEILTLKKIGEQWKFIAPDLKKQYRGFLSSYVAMMARPDQFTEARLQARLANCISNMRQVGVACVMFLQDNDNSFALNADTYKKSIMPYIKNEAVFHCPSDDSGAVSYYFNRNIAGVKRASIASPTTTVMVYEGKDGKVMCRHDGLVVVAFVDGHVKALRPEAVKLLRWKP